MKQTLSTYERGSRHVRRGGLVGVLKEVDDIAARLALPPEVKKRADAICNKAIASGLDRVNAPPLLAAASLYVGCRETRRPVTLRDLGEASGSDAREVGKCYASLLDRMRISRPDLNGKGYAWLITLKRPVSERALKLSQETIRFATIKGLGGRNPMTLAAAALYLACCNLGEMVTQSEVAEAAGVGEESVRECCKAIRMLGRG